LKHAFQLSALWLGCVEMELKLPGGQVDQVAKLHWRALKELKPELVADFITQFTLMHS